MLLFIDESGHDHGEAPYEVLAGVAIRERDLWNLIQAIRSAELDHFGLHMNDVGLEFKGKKLLKRKVFRLAKQAAAIEPKKRRDLTRSFLQKGWIESNGGTGGLQTSEEFAAYGQSAIAFVSRVFGLMASYRVKIFAAMVSKKAEQPSDENLLRKDYSYLFQRFFYYLEDFSQSEMGIIVFDEFEKVKCKILINQLERYFLETEKGYQRSARIIPEPFFVHSDLTTAVQLADIVAYCLNWGLRLKNMNEPIREEMASLAEQAFGLRYVGKRIDELDLQEWAVYGVFYLSDLRPKTQREREE
ncbi:MAG TPA: DUF3800 domain-containing protein [Verrucomicrobiae bacterium]|nr:DUF3800 domain-containing protein [Verrucomicrobiae bacterium]